MKQWFKSLFYGAVITVLLILISIIFAYFFGDKCWPQRFGAIIVGFGLAIEAYALFDPNRVIGGWDGEGPNPIIIKTAITTAIFGTVLWGFGDLFFQPYGYCLIQ